MDELLQKWVVFAKGIREKHENFWTRSKCYRYEPQSPLLRDGTKEPQCRAWSTFRTLSDYDTGSGTAKRDSMPISNLMAN